MLNRDRRRLLLLGKMPPRRESRPRIDPQTEVNYFAWIAYFCSTRGVWETYLREHEKFLLEALRLPPDLLDLPPSSYTYTSSQFR